MALIEILLEEARKRLVETGTRNRLIHINRRSKRANALNIINERSDDIFDLLRVQNKKMRFIAKGIEETSDSEDKLTLTDEVDEVFDVSRYTDLFLETPLTSDALQKRLLKLAKDARTAEEEQGTNILYLNLGFLQWYESSHSSILRESPLILLPVELVRNQKSSTYKIECRDDDIVTNLPLQERLQMDFGIALPDINDNEDWVPSDYFQSVRDAISNQARWALDDNGMQLGFASFAKLLMLRDLEPKNWKKGTLINNPLVRRLLSEGFEVEPPLFGKEDNLDEILEPDQILQVVDADSSQTKAIEEVRSGRNLVVQGPPGTGKSQTITNILAAAAFDKKKVLFVAEKMAALDVVYQRMVKVGLKDLCLELHSRNTNRKAFLAELAETIANARNAEVIPQDTKELKQVRDELNYLTSVLHSPMEGFDRTPFEVLSVLIHFAGQDTPPPKLNFDHLLKISLETEQSICEEIKLYCEALSAYGTQKQHPFCNTTKLHLQPTDQQRLAQQLERARSAIVDWGKYREALSGDLNKPCAETLAGTQQLTSILDVLKQPPANVQPIVAYCHENARDARFKEALEIGLEWVSIKSKLSESFSEAAWLENFSHLRKPIFSGVQSWFSRTFGKYKSASKELGAILKTELPKNPTTRLELIDSLIDAETKKTAFDQEKAYLETRLKDHWRGEQTDFRQALDCLSWLSKDNFLLLEFSVDELNRLTQNSDLTELGSDKYDELQRQVEETVAEVVETLGMETIKREAIADVDLSLLLDQFSEMIAAPEQYDTWTKFALAKQKLVDRGLEFLCEFVESEGSVDRVLSEFRYALNEGRWNWMRERCQELNSISTINRHEIVKKFQHHETNRIKEVPDLIRSQHLAQIPQGSVGEMGFIRGEIGKKQRHQPIRQIMNYAGSIVQRIKPIFLMSPLSVAQFLPREKLKFDLLVIDEASQMRPEDALGSIARARQIVVVGDQKQLPPTSFFDRLTGDDSKEIDESDSLPTARATEMESILSLCETRGLSQSMLEWHYRSRDPSLITVSNIEFYGNRLILPPCPHEGDKNYGLSLRKVPGVYSRGKSGSGRPGTNRIEAEAIAKRLSELANTFPQFSVGVATFSKVQADMLTEVLEFRRRSDPVLNEFLRENKPEHVFVKNIENVQGDERDIILISVGYGPTEPNGRLASMNFGAVSREGGERRLNVLFTRSRIACEVFISFDPNQIHPTKTSKEGTRVLKRFLEYAQSRHLEEIIATGEGADSPFEEEVAQVIRNLGYKVDHQVGTAGFKIDLGVRHPESYHHYILAVECDGATYHSALWARERDRLRQQVLEGFGWSFHRIWSTDWFYRRTEQIDRLKAALEAATQKDFNASIKGSNGTQPERPQETFKVKVEDLDLSSNEPPIPKYQKSTAKADDQYEPHKRPLSQVVDLVVQIVKVEGPIHTEEVVRRYAKAHGKKTGARIREIVGQGLSAAKSEGHLKDNDSFWGTDEQFMSPPVRDRSEETVPLTKPQYLSKEEIWACAELIKKESGEVEIEELIKSIAHMMGFKRTGQELQNRIRDVLSHGLSEPD